jgi:hypothetical protein
MQSNDPDFVAKAIEYNVSSGINPFDYIDEDEDTDEEEEQ